MKRRVFQTMLACAAAAMPIAAPATTLLHATYTGVIGSGTDGGGLFGAVGASLAGKTFSEAFTWDVTGYTTYCNVYCSYDNIENAPGVYSAVTVTVDGVSFSTVGVDGGQIEKEVDPGSTHIDSSISGGYPNVIIGSITVDYESYGYETTIAGPAYVQALFIFNGTEFDAQDHQGRAIVTAEAVPEPTSWAMMLGGFGLIGAAMRNRKRTAVRLA